MIHFSITISSFLQLSIVVFEFASAVVVYDTTTPSIPVDCPSSRTVTLTDVAYPPGTTITVDCPSPLFGTTVTTCTGAGWRPVRPLRACKYYNPGNSTSNLDPYPRHQEYDDYYDTDEISDMVVQHKMKLCAWPTVAPVFPVGANITVECPFGYAPGGDVNKTSTVATCTRNGTWTVDIAKCSSVRGRPCTLPVTPRNGRIYSRSPTFGGTQRGLLQFGRGAFIRYECMDGYLLYGPARITCLDDGEWSTDPPRCERVW